MRECCLSQTKCEQLARCLGHREGSHVESMFSQIRGYRNDTALAVACTAGEMALDVALPYVMSQVIDEGITPGDLGAVVRLGALMVVMAFASLAPGLLEGCALPFAPVAACVLVSAVATTRSTLFIQTLVDDYVSPLIATGSTDFSGLARAMVP